MITAIETRYAGCRFRSRLEARWAVFFDHLKIKWEYEPQGYRVGPDKRPYLPDFRLPEFGAFVEVKGDPERLDVGLLASATMADRETYFMIILGDIPRYEAGAIPLHTILAPAWDLRRGDEPSIGDRNQMYAAVRENEAVARVYEYERRVAVTAQRFTFLAGEGGTCTMPVGAIGLSDAVAAQPLQQETAWWIVPHPKIRDAYEAARSARFEHGESG